MVVQDQIEKTILVLCRELPPVGGGAGAVALELARKYRDHGYRVAYITMRFGDLASHEELERGIEVFRIESGRRNQDSSYLLEMLRFVFAARSEVRRLCRELPVAFIHAHAILPEGLLALAAKGWAGGVPLVVTSHGSDVPGYNPDKFQIAHKVMSPLWHYAVKRFDVLTAPGSHQAGLIEANRPGQKVHVIPNGVQPDVFDDVVPERDGSFLIVSRLVRRKNYHEFFTALARVEAPQRVHVVGDGPVRQELEQQAAGMPQHDITFHGWLAHGSPEWKKLYRTASYFVFPSVNENFPMNLLEAQLAGMLVLATPIPANREVLGEYALFFDGLAAADMEAVLEKVSGEESIDSAAITEAARKRVISNFAWDSIAERFLAVAGMGQGDFQPESAQPVRCA